MRKNSVFLAGLASLALVLGLAGCPTDDGGGSTNPVQYTVDFDSLGGSAVASVTVNDGATLGTLPAAPTKTGYAFGGWVTAADGSGTAFTGTTPVTANITVYATWTATKYTVTFDANGGTVSPASIQAGTGDIGTLPTPTNGLTGSTVFQGWYTQNGTSSYYWGDRFTEAAQVTASITVYAKWGAAAPTPYTVTFDSQGGSAVSNVTVNSGDTLGALPQPTKPGNDFGGWFPAADGSGTAFTGTTPVTANITVYAKWTAQGKKLIITGISGFGNNGITVALFDEDGGVAGGTGTVSGGSVTIDLKTINGSSWGTAWNGTGSYYVLLWDSNTGGNIPTSDPAKANRQGKISFSGTTTTVPWSDFGPFVQGGGSGGKKLTITGISGVSGQIMVVLASNGNGSGQAAGGVGTVSGGSVTIELQDENGGWNGTGSYYVAIFGSNSQNPSHLTQEPISFSNDTTTVAWSKFAPLSSGSSGGKKLTIKEIDGVNFSGTTVVLGDENGNMVAGGFGSISSGSGGGTVTIDLKIFSQGGIDTTTNWTGSGSYYIAVWGSSNGSFSGDPDYMSAEKFSFGGGTTTVQWRNFERFSQ